MDIITLISKTNSQNVAIGSTIGATLGIIAGLSADTEKVSKTYINICQGIVYGGLAGSIVVINPFMPYMILISILGHIITLDINGNIEHNTKKENVTSLPFLEQY